MGIYIWKILLILMGLYYIYSTALFQLLRPPSWPIECDRYTLHFTAWDPIRSLEKPSFVGILREAVRVEGLKYLFIPEEILDA